MRNKLLLWIVGLSMMLTSCGYERIDYGYEGILVNLYGDKKGEGV